MDVDQPSPVNLVKRAAVTYGRRRDTQNHVRDCSVTNCDSPGVQSLSFEGQFTHYSALDVPQGSQFSYNEAMEDASSPKLNHQFNWRARLKALDEAFDNDEEPLAQPRVAQRSSSSPPQKPIQPHPFEENQSTHMDATPNSPVPQHSDGLFRDTSPPPTSGPPSPTSPFDEALEDSPFLTRKIRCPRKRVVSDSECENSSSVSPIHHPINTPLRRSPPTPSTSEFEMPSTRRTSDKHKGKAPARNVPPLRFENESASTSITAKKGNKARRNDDSVRPKTKAPTKKDLRETVLESSRIIASKNIEVTRTEQPKHTITWLFDRIKDDPLLLKLKPDTHSDPISNFSSPAPPVADVANKVGQRASSFGAPSLLIGSSAIVHPHPTNLPRHVYSQPFPVAPDNTDEEMSSVNDLLRQEKAKKTEADVKHSLAEIKQRAIQDAARRSSLARDSDDDLEIVNDSMHVIAQEEAVKRKSDKLLHVTPSKGRARQIALARKSLPQSSSSSSKPFVQANLSEYLRKSAISTFDRKVWCKDTKAPLTAQQLSRALMRQVEAKKLNFIQEKEEEWKERGGTIIQEPTEAGENTLFSDRLQAYVRKGLQATKHDNPTFGSMESEEDDADYVPEERGSASPEPADTDEEGSSDQENQPIDVRNCASQQVDAEDEELQVHRRGICRPRVVTSDDEDDSPRMLVPDSSVLDLESVPNAVVTRNSESEQTEDENDKENSQKLMYDRSDDKENKAVVRHSSSVARLPLGSRPRSLLGIEDGVHRSLSLSSLGGFDAASNPPEQNLRPPLKEIAQDDDPFLSSPSSKSPFTARLLQSTSEHPASPPRASTSQMDPDSPPALCYVRFDRLGSSFSDIENEKNVDKGAESRALLPSFSETPSKHTPAMFAPVDHLANGKGFSHFFSDEKDEGPSFKSSALLGDSNELALSLDLGLQPALDINGTLRRKADSIFEKEQEYVIEIANRQQQQGKHPELYVSENGFLTQTRPMGPDAEQYHTTSSQSSQLLASQLLLGDATPSSSERAPLRTLSFMATQESSEVQPRRRLRRRSTTPLNGKTPVQDDHSLLPPLLISPLSKRNAFDVLGRHSKINAPKRKLEKSEFVAAEAEESDEDELIGFGPIRKEEDDDADDGDEDDEKVVEGLIDDAVMDVETERADLVQEKFREHEVEDDKSLEQLHHDAAGGKYRIKRRERGIGFDEDSDEDEDDENNRRIRRGMNKKRKIDGDTLEDLGRNQETKAFYEAYQRDLVDDDLEFVHLQTDMQMAGGEGDEETKVISTEALNAELREMVRNKETPFLDLEDTSWIDRTDDENDEKVTVKVIMEHSSETPAQRPTLSQTDFGPEHPNRILENDQEKTKLRSWAKGQGGGNQGTGRSVVGAAITGHAKAKVKTGGGSLRTGQAAGGSKSALTTPVPCKLEKGRSMLSVVSDRSSRFA